ncbi:MAG TPA: universal stress protein [Gaiellaceae bacterium]|nr:universal stress protein [Gaiellaceae bacterium]
MKPILLATDGSPSAAEATREAIALAHELGVPLIATAVQHVTMPAYGYYGWPDVYSELLQAEDEHVHKVLAETAELASEAGIVCETVPLEGAVAEQICALAAERDVELVVLGAHGWGAVRRLVFGSVSLGVLHEAPCPVLIARVPAQDERRRSGKRTTSSSATASHVAA